MELSESFSNQQINDKLLAFTEEHKSPLSRPKFSDAEQKSTWKALVNIIRDDNRKECFILAIEAIKIFTRNKNLLDDVVDAAFLDTLLHHAGIAVENSTRGNGHERNTEVILEALRCLSNIYLQCSRGQNFALENQTIPGIMEQMKKYKEFAVPPQVIGFDMKLLFLVTALRPEARTVVSVEYRGLSRLTDLLQMVLDMALDRTVTNLSAKSIAESSVGNNEGEDDDEKDKNLHVELSEDDVLITLDVLKALFNITCGYDTKEAASCATGDEEEQSQLRQLARILHLLLNIGTTLPENKIMVVSNCVNLLTNYPWACTEPLIAPLNKDFSPSDLEEIEYDGACMNVPQTLVDFLDATLNKCSGGKADSGLKDSLTPILKVLVCVSKQYRLVRKYYRQTILPPLRDLSKRPEEGNTIRNKLCRLLTSPETSVSTMVAEFLFVLCKEKVGRFVKHTGYGNAAGLLARRGLMLGGKGDDTYSDTDSDSDTEEYVQNAHKVNPVSGCVEPQRPSPFEGMTEEQKEYEANKLANLIHQLHSMGAVKPAKIGPDGRPVEVDHVLELLENATSTVGQVEEQQSSDSD